MRFVFQSNLIVLSGIRTTTFWCRSVYGLIFVRDRPTALKRLDFDSCSVAKSTALFESRASTEIDINTLAVGSASERSSENFSLMSFGNSSNVNFLNPRIVDGFKPACREKMH